MGTKPHHPYLNNINTMEEKIEKTQEQINEERFISSFAYAMEVYAKKYREAELAHGPMKRNAYDRIKADGNWKAE